MSEHHDPNDNLTSAPKPESTTLPPYRQPDAPLSQAAKLPLWLWPVLIAVLIVGVLFGKYWGATTEADKEQTSVSASVQGMDKASASTTEQSVLSVETVSPSQANISNTLTADGVISAKDTANVSAKVTGVAIEQVLVEEGARVTAGQVLAVFDTEAMQQQVLQAQADVAEAEATLDNASVDAARVLPLLDIDAISKQEADRYRTSKIRAEASLQASKARLNSQRLTLNNATVVAPVSGIISAKMIEVGMVAGGEPLFTIIKDGILEWQADIDPKLIGEVTVGTAVQVSLPQNQSVTGEVRRIAPTADNNRLITIYASLNTHPAARAGMYQTGQFLLGSSDAQTVPHSAIVSNDGYDYVMLVTAIDTQEGKTLGRIQQHRVSLGARIGDTVALLEPLPNDSRLVKQGGGFLNDGDHVRVVDGLNAPDNSDKNTPKTVTTKNNNAAQATS